MDEQLKIAFDIGGVLSKYHTLRSLFNILLKSSEDLYIITDMHDKQAVLQMLKDNQIFIEEDKIYCADYDRYGEMCKAVLCKALGIDIIIDDFPGYLEWDSQFGESPVRLFVKPDPWKPYWSEDWKCSGGDFGRRVAPRYIMDRLKDVRENANHPAVKFCLSRFCDEYRQFKYGERVRLEHGLSIAEVMVLDYLQNLGFDNKEPKFVTSEKIEENSSKEVRFGHLCDRGLLKKDKNRYALTEQGFKDWEAMILYASK